MKVFLTGASGHLGGRLARALLLEGHHVRGLVRSGRRPPEVPRDADFQVVHGDLLDADACRRGAAGCEVAYHVASPYALWAPRPGAITHTAVTGTRHVMEACAAARIRRVVVTSSAVTMGFSRDPQRPFDEHQENDGRGQDEYNESKWRAERMAFQRGGELGIEVVTVHPSLVLGPGDHHVTPSNRVVTDFLLGRIPGWYEGGFSPVHVDDVARGHILAMTAGRAGERYLLTGTNVRFRELLERLGALTGLGVPRLRIPKRAALLAAATYELAARLGGPPPLVTRAAVHHLYGTYDWYDCSKARRELAYAPRPLDEVLVDALLWFLEQGDRVPPRRRHDVLLHLRSR